MTGQFPKKRETHQDARIREQAIKDNNLEKGYDKDGNLIGKFDHEYADVFIRRGRK